DSVRSRRIIGATDSQHECRTHFARRGHCCCCGVVVLAGNTSMNFAVQGRLSICPVSSVSPSYAIARQCVGIPLRGRSPCSGRPTLHSALRCEDSLPRSLSSGNPKGEELPLPSAEHC